MKPTRCRTAIIAVTTMLTSAKAGAQNKTGALIGGVVSFYGLGILAGGALWVFIIPGALIGMGIGSTF